MKPFLDEFFCNLNENVPNCPRVIADVGKSAPAKLMNNPEISEKNVTKVRGSC